MTPLTTCANLGGRFAGFDSEPIGAGLMKSLTRYANIRSEYPDLPMMMGIGNVTELSDVDSAGVNLLLLAICEELQISSILTTEVINWARTSVRECDIARRIVHYSHVNQVPPKRLSDDLVMLGDDRLMAHSLDTFRLWLIRSKIIITVSSPKMVRYICELKALDFDSDPFRLFDRLLKQEISNQRRPGACFLSRLRNGQSKYRNHAR